MINRIKDMTVPVEKAKTMREEELIGKFPIGVFINKEGIDLNTRYDELLARVQK